MRITPPMPEDRHNDPKRQAELAIYLQLEASDVAGESVYEARPDRHGREIDFVIWLEDVARIVMQVKGGQYRIERGIWYLSAPDGEEKKSTPAKQTWESALQFNRFLQEKIEGNRNPFVVPVLAFPDMDPDSQIEAWAAQAGIHVIFGTEGFMERLVELAVNARVYFPPTAEEIAEEVALVLPEEPASPLGADPAPAAVDLQARQVIIQRADVVNVYTTAAE